MNGLFVGGVDPLGNHEPNRVHPFVFISHAECSMVRDVAEVRVPNLRIKDCGGLSIWESDRSLPDERDAVEPFSHKMFEIFYYLVKTIIFALRIDTLDQHHHLSPRCRDCHLP